METTAQKLCSLVNKKYVIFVERGNTAIRLLLELLKKQGRKRVLIQDQGGWLTYPQFVEKLGLEKVELKTDYGLVNPRDILRYPDSVLLINSMPGYSVLQDMEEIANAAEKSSVFILNDVSGSIGTDEARFGDVIFGSFGSSKPIDIGHGAFVATDDKKIYRDICELNTFIQDESFIDELGKKLDLLDERLSFFQIKRIAAIEDLKTHDIIHPYGGGINLIVKFNNESEKEDIIGYCEEQGLEHTLCPRYIRVNSPAVSIEIKRLNQKPEFEIDEEYDEVE